jgi:hypothetical protein
MESRTTCNTSAAHRFGTTPSHFTVCKCIRILLWSLLSSALLMCSCLSLCSQKMNFEHWVQWGWMKESFWSITTCTVSSSLMDSACWTFWNMKTLYTIFNNSVPIEQCIAITKTTVTVLLMTVHKHTHRHTYTYIHTYTFTCIHTRIHTYTHTHSHTHTYIHIHTHIM